MKRTWSFGCSLFVSLAAVVSPVVADVPLVFDGKFDAPDFYQLNEAYPNGGAKYCVPTSAADGVVWLHEHGFDLLPDMTQEETIVLDLASAMNTSSTGGTTTGNACAGLRDYLGGYYDPSDIIVEYMSPLDVQYCYSPGALDSALTWAQERLIRPDTCLLFWGKVYDQYGNRISYHSTMLAGYDVADYDTTDQFTVYLHDPATLPSGQIDEYTVEVRLSTSAPCYYFGADGQHPDYPGLELEVIWTDAISFQIVPEPAALLLLAMGGLALLRRRGH